MKDPSRRSTSPSIISEDMIMNGHSHEDDNPFAEYMWMENEEEFNRQVSERMHCFLWFFFSFLLHDWKDPTSSVSLVFFRCFLWISKQKRSCILVWFEEELIFDGRSMPSLHLLFSYHLVCNTIYWALGAVSLHFTIKLGNISSALESGGSCSCFYI